MGILRIPIRNVPFSIRYICVETLSPPTTVPWPDSADEDPFPVTNSRGAQIPCVDCSWLCGCDHGNGSMCQVQQGQASYFSYALPPKDDHNYEDDPRCGAHIL